MFLLSSILTLLKYNSKSLFRERTLIFVIILFPVALILAASASAPTDTLPLKFDGKFITPPPEADEVIVALYAITAVALVMSILSFFATFQLKQLIPRLKISGYSPNVVLTAIILMLLIVNIFVSVLVVGLSLYWIEPQDYWGVFTSVFLSGMIFATLGIIVASVVDTKHLGLNLILTIAVIDAGFLENPVYSRRYDEQWMRLMPAFGPIRMLLRSIYDTGTPWVNELLSILAYELILILVLLAIVRLVRKA